MTRTVSISIEGAIVKVVYATLKGRRIRIDDSLVFPEEKLDDFLLQEKTRDFILNVDFKELYQDTVLIPPVKANFIRPLIASELRKKNPTRADSTPLYFKVGEKTVDGKRLDEFFVLSAPAAEIEELTERFLSKGKRIKALYPHLLAALKVLPVRPKPYLFLHRSSNKNNLFLIREGRVLFARSALKSDDRRLVDLNMTVNYCLQALRVEPEELIVVGETEQATSMELSIPEVCFVRPDYIHCSTEQFLDFFIPISSLGTRTLPCMWSEEYESFYAVSNIVHYSTSAFITLSILLAVLLCFNLFEFQYLKEETGALRSQNLDLVSILKEHRIAKDELIRAKPLFDFMNDMNTLPSPSRLLYLISPFRAEQIDFRDLEIHARGKRRLDLKMKGHIVSESLLQAQRGLDRFVAGLQGVEEITNVDSTTSIKQRNVTIAAEFGGEEIR